MDNETLFSYKKRIGIFGGAFDPVHSEHVKIVSSFIDEINPDMVIVLPSLLPPHKTIDGLSFESRLKIAKVAFEGIEKCEVSDYEVQSGKLINYTYATLEHFASVYPKSELIFIIGGDSLQDFETWKYPEKIVKLCRICAIKRQGYKNFESQKLALEQKYGINILTLQMLGRDISSTEIRARLYLNYEVENVISQNILNAMATLKNDNIFLPYVDYAKKNLSPSLYNHSCRVVIYALKLNRKLKLSFKSVFLSSLLHDIGKEACQNVEGYDAFDKEIRHQFVGCDIAQSIGIVEKEILDAIKYHTTARPNMTLLDAVVFLSDKLEEKRNYDGIDSFRETAETDIYFAVYRILKHNITYLNQKGKEADSLTLDTINFYRRHYDTN